MRGAERVVFALGALGEAGQPAALAQRADAVAPAGQNLVRIGSGGRRPRSACRSACRTRHAAPRSVRPRRGPRRDGRRSWRPRRWSRCRSSSASCASCSADRFFMSLGRWMRSSSGVLEALGQKHSATAIGVRRSKRPAGLHQIVRGGQFNAGRSALIRPVFRRHGRNCLFRLGQPGSSGRAARSRSGSNHRPRPAAHWPCRNWKCALKKRQRRRPELPGFHRSRKLMATTSGSAVRRLQAQCRDRRSDRTAQKFRMSSRDWTSTQSMSARLASCRSRLRNHLASGSKPTTGRLAPSVSSATRGPCSPSAGVAGQRAAEHIDGEHRAEAVADDQRPHRRSLSRTASTTSPAKRSSRCSSPCACR